MPSTEELTPPIGYVLLPKGQRCRCIALWVDGKGNAYCCNSWPWHSKKPPEDRMDVKKQNYVTDFGMQAVSEAAAHFGTDPADLVFFVSTNYAALAQEAKDRYRCQVYLLPPEVLQNSDAWACQCDRDWFWSPGQ